MKFNKRLPLTLKLTSSNFSLYRSLMFYSLLLLLAASAAQALLLAVLCARFFGLSRAVHTLNSLVFCPQRCAAPVSALEFGVNADFTLNGRQGFRLHSFCFWPDALECVFLAPDKLCRKKRVFIFRDQLSLAQWRQLALSFRLMT